MELSTEPLSASFTMGDNPALPDGWETSTLVPMVIAFEATAEGAYTVNVEVDGNSKSIPLLVTVIH
jgi:hypothetical protein